MQHLFEQVDALPGAGVVSPYTDVGARQIAADGQIAYAQLDLAQRSVERYQDIADRIEPLADAARRPGLEIELGGNLFADQAMPPSESVGFGSAVVILLLAFGSVLAMGLPIVTAAFGVGTGIAIVKLVAPGVEMPNFTTPVAIGIGIGVGIDYALFIVTRFREDQRGGDAPGAAVADAIDTAGRAVLFAGSTVVISLMGMFAMRLTSMQGLAVGASLTVLMTMVAAVTLLPAALAVVGRNIDRLSIPHRAQRTGPGWWHRWSKAIQRRPWPAAIAGVVVLGVLAVPVHSLRLGFADAGNRPRSDTTRRAYDLLTEGFGVGVNGPLILAAQMPGGRGGDAVQALSQRLADVPGVAYASPPLPNAAGTVAVIEVIPTTSPQSEQTTELVHHLRDDVVPAVTGGTPATVDVGGITAASIDFASYTGRRLPYFFGAVPGLSFVLLMLVFRSVLVPLKAVVMNMLSIGAAYGVVVAVFQWGWLGHVVGIGRPGPIEAWVPMMLFAIVFGLSMDYSRPLKLFGLGTAVAIFVDATLVRLVLVPATMELLGDANWWLPRWLGRLLPSLHVEGSPSRRRQPRTPPPAPGRPAHGPSG